MYQYWAQPTSFITKKAVVDDTVVITGSHNWSKTANRTNDENLLIINSPTVAAQFHKEEERLLEQAKFGPNTTLQVQNEYIDMLCGSIDRSQFIQDDLAPININKASVESLTQLPGIGSVLAERIVQARPFTSFEDLIRVKGIGTSKLDDLRGKVSW